MDTHDALYHMLRNIVAIALIALAILIVFRRFKLPSVIGFLATGVLLGPQALGFVGSTHEIETMAEIGVVLLLFSIGMEFSLEELFRWKRWILVGGGGQIVLTTTISAGLMLGLGVGWKTAVFIGALVSLSSTALVLKAFVERNELHAPHGRLSTAILLAQDLAIIPYLIFLPLLGGEAVQPIQVAISVGKAVGILGGMLILARWFVPRFLKQLAQLRSQEAFVLGALVLCLGSAWITAEAGLSLAIGAFIAGIIVSESEYSNQIVADVLPFRDSFGALFFISIGMLLVIPTSVEGIARVGFGVIAMIGLKFVVTGLVAAWVSKSWRIGILSGLALAQIGEFSFVLLGVGTSSGLVDDAQYQEFLAIAVISMMATPFMIAAAPKIAARFPIDALRASEPHEEELRDHVIIVGFGLTGQNVAHALCVNDEPYVVIEMNPTTVQVAKVEENEPIMFGDASRHEILEHAHIERAKMLVVTIPDPNAARRIVQTARQSNPQLSIIVRTQFASEVAEFIELGASEVVPEEFEASVQIVQKTLEGLGASPDTLQAQIAAVRALGHRYYAHSPVITKKT